ncbi:MAG TPA: squalene synthase HpnC [Blastocatellia bacterium]|jgi:phytoene synthase|nr:squalene synthase HpnC [Blastocatellia bacterium]
MGTPLQYRRSLAAETLASTTTGRQWTIESSYEFCERLAKSHYENFPVGSLLIPARLRKHVYAIYAFARTADDLADEGYEKGLDEESRLASLAQWREMLETSSSGEASHPIFVALRETRSKFKLPLDLFEDLLSAFEQDVTTRRYQRFDQLLDYCRRSANPIGRLILLLFGNDDEGMNRRSDDICTGLQLTNHWQDVAVDLDKDRIYLPEEDMRRFGVTVEDLKSRRISDRYRELLEFEVKRTHALFNRGKPLCVQVNGRLGLELRTIWLAGTRILERIESAGYDTLTRRPVISTLDKISILISALSRKGFWNQ